jgi:hypothetical protein
VVIFGDNVTRDWDLIVGFGKRQRGEEARGEARQEMAPVVQEEPELALTEGR